MSKQVIEEAIKKYAEIKANTESEIAKIKEQLFKAGVPGETIVKMQPKWQPEVQYLLKKAM